MKQVKKINIQSTEYNNNLDFYTMLKLLIQCQLNDRQLIMPPAKSPVFFGKLSYLFSFFCHIIHIIQDTAQKEKPLQ